MKEEKTCTDSLQCDIPSTFMPQSAGCLQSIKQCGKVKILKHSSYEKVIHGNGKQMSN